MEDIWLVNRKQKYISVSIKYSKISMEALGREALGCTECKWFVDQWTSNIVKYQKSTWFIPPDKIISTHLLNFLHIPWSVICPNTLIIPYYCPNQGPAQQIIGGVKLEGNISPCIEFDPGIIFGHQGESSWFLYWMEDSAKKSLLCSLLEKFYHGTFLL